MKKKYIGIAAVALLLAGAVWWSIAGDSARLDGDASSGIPASGDPAEAVAGPVSLPTGVDYYEAFRTERDGTRELELDYLDEIIQTSASDSETLEDAQAQKLALVSQMEAEFAVENLIRAKGFEDAAVTFHQGSVSVVVKCAELTGEEAAQILEIVMSETGEEAGSIRIITNPGS